MSVTTLIKDRTAIAGIGMAPYGRGIEFSEEHLAGMAVKQALDDAGIDASEVDGLVSYDMEVTALEDEGGEEEAFDAQGGGGAAFGDDGGAAGREDDEAQGEEADHGRVK